MAEVSGMMKRIDGCCTVGVVNGGLNPEVEALLGAMDRAGVDAAVIMPPDRCFGWENEAGNTFAVGLVKRYGGRFIPAVTVNPWRPDAVAVAASAIEAGGRLLAFAPGVQGFNPSGELLDPVLAMMTKRNMKVPVYVHTGHHSHGAPSQLAMPAARFPELSFIMGHSGATDYAGDVAPVCKLCANICIESSFARPPGFVARLKAVGFARGIMGSGWPYNDLAFEWSEMRRLLPAEHQEAVLGGTLTRLLGESR